MNLFLVPASQENIDVTIRRAVSWEILERLLPPNEYQRLRHSLGNNPVHCWAVTRNKQAIYNAMGQGDRILITIKATNAFNYCCAFADKVHSLSLGNYLWPVVPRGPWEYIYFLKDIKPIKKAKKHLVVSLGYKPTYDVCGSSKVDPSKLSDVLRRYGSFDDFLAAIPDSGQNPHLLHTPLIAREATTILQTKPEYVIPQELCALVERIKSLKTNSNHHERDNESLVEEFYRTMGYSAHGDIAYRQGRVDILITNESKPFIVNEVKRAWNLTRLDSNILKQAYGYAQEQGVQYVVITNGDYYACYDRGKFGFSYNDHFVFEFKLTELQTIDLPNLEFFRKHP